MNKTAVPTPAGGGDPIVTDSMTEGGLSIDEYSASKGQLIVIKSNYMKYKASYDEADD